MNAPDVVAGITAALRVGAVTADVVAVEARRAPPKGHHGGIRSDRHPGQQQELVEHRVVSLTQRAWQTLRRHRRPACGQTPAALGGRLRRAPAKRPPAPAPNRHPRSSLMRPTPPVVDPPRPFAADAG